MTNINIQSQARYYEQHNPSIKMYIFILAKLTEKFFAKISKTGGRRPYGFTLTSSTATTRFLVSNNFAFFIILLKA